MKVLVPSGVTPPNVGDRVALTAICSSELRDGDLRPVLLVRSASDIVSYEQ
ncbi:MAG: hypothetical protein QHI38_02215 [Armatimonadota bacterium]|nr:hypothetical protein [Armatimonadota bacterium]